MVVDVICIKISLILDLDVQALTSGQEIWDQQQSTVVTVVRVILCLLLPTLQQSPTLQQTQRTLSKHQALPQY